MTTKAAPAAPQQTALAVIDAAGYAVLSADADAIREALRDNLGGQALASRDLVRVTVPPGGVKMWELENDDGSYYADAIEGIIVAMQDTRAWWRSSEATGTPPDCSSPDMSFGMGEFGPGSAGNPSGACLTCPMSRFGSAREGSLAQACKQKRDLYIVRPDDALPIVVSVPPSSLRALEIYMRRTLAGKGLSRLAVVTRLELDEEKNPNGQKFSVIRPSVAGRIPPEQVRAIRQYAEGMEAALFTQTQAPTPPGWATVGYDESRAPAFDEHGEPIETSRA